MKIENRELDEEKDYLSPVTYIPDHAHGSAGHPDCEQGVIVSIGEKHVRVLYSKSRTVQFTDPESLVWG